MNSLSNFQQRHTHDESHQSESVNPYLNPRPASGSPIRGAIQFELDDDLLPKIRFAGEPQAVTRQSEFQTGLQQVKAGLSTYCNGFFLLTLCWFLGLVLGGNPGNPGAIYYILVIGKAFGLLLILEGELRCLNVPRKSDAYQPVWLSVFFYLINAIAQLVLALFFTEMKNRLIFALVVLQAVSGLIANILFLTFVYRLAAFLGESNLYNRAGRLRREFGQMVSFAIGLLLFTLVFAGNRQNAALIVAMIALIGLLLYFYGWMSRFIQVVFDTSKSIDL